MSDSGMLRFGRKRCATCGNECLEADPRCWACGGWQFGPAPREITADIPGPHLAGETTLGWEATGSGWPRWRLPAAIGAAVVAATFAGFWLGRHSARSDQPAAATEPPKVVTSQPLPTPPTDLHPAADDQPIVEIHPLGPVKNASPAQHSGNGRAAQAAAPVPAPAYNPPRWPAVIPPAAARPPLRAAGAPASSASSPASSAPAAPAPAPEGKDAVVALRNNAPVSVEVRFEGFNGASDGSVIMSPGAAFEVSMGPGDYRVQVAARGADGDSAKAVLVSKRRYAFVIDTERAQGDGGTALKLREPALTAERP